MMKDDPIKTAGESALRGRLLELRTIVLDLDDLLKALLFRINTIEEELVDRAFGEGRR